MNLNESEVLNNSQHAFSGEETMLPRRRFENLLKMRLMRMMGCEGRKLKRKGSANMEGARHGGGGQRFRGQEQPATCKTGSVDISWFYQRGIKKEHGVLTGRVFVV